MRGWLLGLGLSVVVVGLAAAVWRFGRPSRFSHGETGFRSVASRPAGRAVGADGGAGAAGVASESGSGDVERDGSEPEDAAGSSPARVSDGGAPIRPVMRRAFRTGSALPAPHGGGEAGVHDSSMPPPAARPSDRRMRAGPSSADAAGQPPAAGNPPSSGGGGPLPGRRPGNDGAATAISGAEVPAPVSETLLRALLEESRGPHPDPSSAPVAPVPAAEKTATSDSAAEKDAGEPPQPPEPSVISVTQGIGPPAGDSSVSMTLSFQLDPSADYRPTGLILARTLPPGWTLQSAAPPVQSYNARTREAKWLFVGAAVSGGTVAFKAVPDAAGPPATWSADSGWYSYRKPDGQVGRWSIAPGP